MSKKNIILKKKLKKLLNKLEIKKGSRILLHSNSAGFLQFIKTTKSFDTFFKILIKQIGREGTLVVPTYNYNFTKGCAFDKSKSISQVGAFTNYLIKKYNQNRTNDPIFSHLIFGKLFRKLNNCKNEEVFGRKSIFAHFEKYNFQIVCFCCPPNKMTFLHYIEKKTNVKYRFNKIFNGKIKIKNKYKVIKVKYYVGKRNVNYTIKGNNLLKLINKRKFREESFGRFLCYTVRTKYLANIVRKKLSKNQYFLIK